MATYLDSEHRFHYDTATPITAAMLAESLLGLQGIVRRSADALERLLDTHIKDADVIVTSITFGSCDEKFTIRYYFGQGRAGERNLQKLKKQLHLKNMNMKKAVGAILAGAVLYAGLHFVTSSPKGPQETEHIEKHFDNLGKSVGMTKDELIGLFKVAIRNKEDLKRQAVKLAHPAGSTDSGNIVFDGDETFTVPSAVTKEIPFQYSKEAEDAPSADFDKEEVVIRAADLDRPGTGWAAIILSISDKRLPVQLGEGVDPMKVPIGRIAVADVTVFYKTDSHGNKSPQRYLLRKFHRKESGEPVIGSSPTKADSVIF